jgi:predicted secreted hydrolase
MSARATAVCVALASGVAACSGAASTKPDDGGVRGHEAAASSADGQAGGRDSSVGQRDGASHSGNSGSPSKDAATSREASVDAGAPDAGETNLCGIVPDAAVHLPADDSQHDDLVEWWYWTGHLTTPDAGAYGFEECFFRTEAIGVVTQLVNVALTDIGGQSFHYGDSLAAGAPASVPDGFSLSIAGSTADGGDGHDHLHGEPPDASFDLDLLSIKAPVLESPSGYIAYSGGGWTYYYSRMLLSVTGTLSVHGSTVPVTGEAWFDHQWGDLAQAVVSGWEWFSIQLEDGRDIMLNFPLVSGSPGPGSGTLSDANCHVTSSDVTMSSTGTWKSPHTGCTYPAGWKVTIQGLSLTITPAVADQELVAPSAPTYWEGAATVTGDATGKGYVELNGFCP